MKEMGISWNAPSIYGVPFMKKLHDCLWYIDGHRDTISEKAPKLPQRFTQFSGYNCPKAHKHQKRTKGNLSMAQLRTHSLALQDCLQSSWFRKEQFKELKEAVEGVVATLSVYTAYLQDKNKSQKLHHLLSCPASSPSDSSHLQLLPQLLKILSNLQPVDSALNVKPPFEPVSVADFAPYDWRQRYRFV